MVMWTKDDGVLTKVKIDGKDRAMVCKLFS